MRRMVCVVTANISGSRSAFSMTKRATRKFRLGKLPGYILRHSGSTKTVTGGLMLVSLRWCSYFSIQSVVKASLVSLNKEESPRRGSPADHGEKGTGYFLRSKDSLSSLQA